AQTRGEVCRLHLPRAGQHLPVHLKEAKLYPSNEVRSTCCSQRPGEAKGRSSRHKFDIVQVVGKDADLHLAQDNVGTVVSHFSDKTGTRLVAGPLSEMHGPLVSILMEEECALWTGGWRACLRRGV